MGGTVVGVDIGGASIRAVEVQGYEGGKPSIVRYGEVPLPDSAVRRGEVVEVGTVGTAMKRLWATGGFKTKDVVLGMGGSRVFARDLQVPRGPMTQVRESLPFLVQDLLPIPVADAILDFYPLQEEQGESGPVLSGLLVAGVTEAITANVSSALAAGLNPVHVDLMPFAVTRALAPTRSARGRDVLLDIGAYTTNLVVVDNGIPHFVRMIGAGGDDVTRAIASKLQWAPEQAEAAKRAIGMGGPMMRAEDRPVLEIIYEVVGEQLSNIRNTLSYYSSSKPNEPVQRILLTGGASQLVGLPKALSEVTGLPVNPADALANVSVAKPKRAAERMDHTAYTAAFGLALGSHA